LTGVTRRNKSNYGNNLHFSSVCSFRLTREREDTMLIKYKFSDEFMEVIVKKTYSTILTKSIRKNYPGTLFVNAEKLKDILDLLQ
jgi:hypothetical protein